MFFFKQKTAYEWRISDWISDVCSSDLLLVGCGTLFVGPAGAYAQAAAAQPAGSPGTTYRLSPILVDSGVKPDDDANSVVAHELWVGGKVVTSVLDTPASVSVLPEKIGRAHV